MRQQTQAERSAFNPFEEGESAYFAGRSHYDNPYPIGSKSRAEWARGMGITND